VEVVIRGVQGGAGDRCRSLFGSSFLEEMVAARQLCKSVGLHWCLERNLVPESDCNRESQRINCALCLVVVAE